jgi:methionyl-tRNA synthetase
MKFNNEYIQKIKENMSLINSARADLINNDFTTATYKVHLVLINLNNFVHASEFWKKQMSKDELSQLSCYVYEFIRIATILYRPLLPQLMININKFIGIGEDKVFLDFSYFRLADEENKKQVYSDEFNLSDDFQKFNEESKSGYFNIDMKFKEIIFINKKNK